MNKLGHYGKCTLDRNATDFPQRLKSTVFPNEIHIGKSALNWEFLDLWNLSVEKVNKIKKCGKKRKFMLEDFAVDLHCLHNKIRNNKLSLWILTSPLGKSATNLQRIRYRNWHAEDLKSTLHVNFHLDTVQFFSALYVLDFLKFHARCCYNRLPICRTQSIAVFPSSCWDP